MKAYGVEKGNYQCCGSGHGTKNRHRNCFFNKYGNDVWCGSRDAIKRKNRRAKKKARQEVKRIIKEQL